LSCTPISAATPYDQLPQQLTVEEFIAITRCSRATAYAHIREKKIPAIRYGKLIRIPKSALTTEAR
jgi:excisionase family DNA binding protein